jgi:hypothetical protein
MAMFGMMQSLDGYADHQEFAPGPSLLRYFIEQVRDRAPPRSPTGQQLAFA